MVALVVGIPAQRAHGQLMLRTTVLENVTIHVGDGTVIENGTVILRGRRVAQVGSDIPIPRGATRIDGRGLHVTPGLIDLGSALAMPGGAGGGNALTANAADAFDRFDRRSIEEAIAQGVTLVTVAPTGHRGFGPAASLIRLQPAGDAAIGEVVESRIAVTLNMRSEDAPIARLQLVDTIRTRLREAREREKAIDAYERELEEFLKKIEESKKESESGSGNGAAPAPAATPRSGAGAPPQRGAEPPPRPSPPTRRPRPGTADEGDSEGDRSNDDQEETIDEVGRVVDAADVDRAETAGADRDDDLQQRQRRQGPPPAPAAQPRAPEAPPRSESKRPQPPAPNRPLDVLIQAMNHELPIHVRADRSEDILNALRIADEFGLKIVLEGGAEAHLVAGELAAAGVPVILSLPAGSDLPRRGAQPRTTPDAAAILTRAGVEWAFASGDNDPRHLLMAAQLFSQRAGTRVDSIELVTMRPARMLGVDDRYGSIAEGKIADLVLWSGDPHDPGSRVQRVFMSGETVFEFQENES